METSEEAVVYCVSGDDPEVAAHLKAMAEALRRQAGDTIERLERRYHVDREMLFEILEEHGFRLRYGDVWALFQGRTSEEIESWEKTFSLAAERLKLASPLLLQEWSDSLMILLSDGREWGVNEEAFDFSTTPAQPPASDTELSEECERVEVANLARSGGARLDVKSKSLLVPFPEQLAAAIQVLEKAALTFRRREFKSAVYSETGRPIFGRGPRIKFANEAACAHDLVEFFRSETSKPLYEYAGLLLMAIFPESCGRWGAGKRLRDRVKQLLKNRGPQIRPSESK